MNLPEKNLQEVFSVFSIDFILLIPIIYKKTLRQGLNHKEKYIKHHLKKIKHSRPCLSHIEVFMPGNTN